jgi:uncharacterized protein YyaL (SSP411 family)
MTTDTAPANRLARATSPYLLQHAHNPVDWYEWGEEALARARAEQKPILLSIGYSACHWCHVMAHESFEDPATAAIMNAHFVNVKVDREERPDLDDIYMAATQAMNQGQGGWPMTVFLTPDQQPFFAGTYFPPTDAYGRPGFPTLLRRIAELWGTSREKLVAQGAQLTRLLRESSVAAPGAVDIVPTIAEAVRTFERTFDQTWGGFGRAPKFPPSQPLRLLLRVAKRQDDHLALRMVTTTLDAMAQGGMYDQIGSGFARYSTDERWLVPHFEKMLYDNAQLAVAYLEGWQATKRPLYRRIAVETLEYVLREMTSPEGGFWSATDADSEGVEGKFFVWGPEEVTAVVGADDAPLVLDWYDISERGNWEGTSVPHTPRPLADVARRHGLELAEAERRIARARGLLYEARARRVPPGLDDKILTAWNGLMIGALADGARILGDSRYREAAARAADFVLGTMRDAAGNLQRVHRAGHTRLDAYLEDFAYLADGLVSLYESGADVRYLHEAHTLVTRIRTAFRAPDGGFFSTAEQHETLVLRPREGFDGATPSANAVAARAMARLSYHVDDRTMRDEARRALEAYGQLLTEQPRAFATSLMTLDLLAQGPVELAFIGAADDERRRALERATAEVFVPHLVVGHHDPAIGSSELPLLAGKTTVDATPALYVCRDYACRRPVTRAEDVAAALAAPR